MRLLESIPDEAVTGKTALTVGTFDGVHRGHAALVGELAAGAAPRGLQTAVVTFTDMPYLHFNAAACARLLTLPQEKAEAFGHLGIDLLAMVPFDGGIASQTAGEFVSHVLVEKLGMKLFVCGPDFALGKGRQGDTEALRRMGASMGFDVQVLREKVGEAGEFISSTRIRECVEAGQVANAARLLGRPFSLSGKVVRGEKIGRSIGVPTINLEVHPRKVLPANGVYAVRASWPGITRSYPAALNVGTRPTVGGTRLSVEFHVIGEVIDVPPATASLEIVEKLRDERRFANVGELSLQLRRDIEQASRLLHALG